jgi:hypothetical protein
VERNYRTRYGNEPNLSPSSLEKATLAHSNISLPRSSEVIHQNPGSTSMALIPRSSRVSALPINPLALVTEEEEEEEVENTPANNNNNISNQQRSSI